MVLLPAPAPTAPCVRSQSRERRSAWRTGSGMRWRVHRHTSARDDASDRPCPTETSTGLKVAVASGVGLPEGAVVRSAAPHTAPESPTSSPYTWQGLCQDCNDPDVTGAGPIEGRSEALLTAAAALIASATSSGEEGGWCAPPIDLTAVLTAAAPALEPGSV